MRNVTMRRRGREAVTLGAGLLCGAALAWVALSVQPAPGVVGELEVARARRALGEQVRNAWTDLLASPELPVPGIGPELLDAPRLPVPLTLPACESQSEAAAALLLQARRVETLGHPGQEAIDLVQDACATATSRACRVASELRRVLYAARAGDADGLAEALTRSDSSLTWDVVAAGHVPRALAWLAALPRLGAAEHETLRAAGRADLLDNAHWLLASNTEQDRLEWKRADLVLELAAPTAALIESLDEQLPGFGVELRTTAAWQSRVQTAFGKNLPVGESGRWTLHAAEPLPVLVRTQHPARFVQPQDLVDALLRRCDLPAGFELDFGLAEPSALPSLDSTLVLTPGVLSAAVHHANPNALTADAVGRQRLVRWSLLALAAAILAASIIAALALARERRLGELKSAFVAGVSHDLRTPLASILLMAENLESGRVGPDRVQLYHGTIRAEAERLRRRVDDVLDFARLERGEALSAMREHVPAEPLITELQQLCADKARAAGVELQFDAADVPAELQLDPDALRRCVVNLVDNALRHARARRVSVLLEGAAGCELRASVRDDGRGVTGRARRRMFVPFERGRAAQADPQGGTGLGLGIVRALARAHGGDVTLSEGLDGRGIGFEVTFGVKEST